MHEGKYPPTSFKYFIAHYWNQKHFFFVKIWK